jgi:hypothetical protein
MLLLALDELEASKQRHPATGRRRDDEHPNVIPLFPQE